MTGNLSVEERRMLIASELVFSTDIGATLRKWRMNCDLNQNDLALLTKISPSRISEYESGKYKSMTIGTAKRFVEVLADYVEIVCEAPA